MGQKDKLLQRFLRLPKDFTFEETVTLLGYLGYSIHNKGATSGSRIRFVNASGEFIDLHRPHPGSIMKEWMMKKNICTSQIKEPYLASYGLFGI